MRLLSILLLGCILLTSCKKKETPDYVTCFPNTPSFQRITEESFYQGPDTTFRQKWAYVYDASDRVIFELTTTGGKMDTVARYTYYNDKIVMNSEEYILNDRGLAISLGNIKTWKYNADGYLTEETSKIGYTITSLFYYSCFNPEQIITLAEVGPAIRTDTTFYKYYYDKVNTIGNENHGISFLGRQNNTLLESKSKSGQVLESYTYVFDSMNRVLWEIITDQNGNLSYRKFSYL
jgi:YD repeat-containing protein